MEEEALLPSGSAALYRRDDARRDRAASTSVSSCIARIRTWACARAGAAGSACIRRGGGRAPLLAHGRRASPSLKAYYVERNRLFVLAKIFPARLLWVAPWAAAARYFWHLAYLIQGRGSAARFRAGGHNGARMLWYVAKAHWGLLALPLVVAGAAEHPARRAHRAGRVPRTWRRLLGQRPAGGGAMTCGRPRPDRCW